MARIHPEAVLHRRCSFKFINDNIIGKDASFKGPFGEKRVVYCDYTASGKSLQCIENFIHDRVYPFYANTHTTTNITGLQTTKLREQARDIIKECVNAGKDDMVIFTGSGVTGAIHKLIHILNVLDNVNRTIDGHNVSVSSYVTVIVGPFEHHSNILPWKESGCTVLRVRDGKDGNVDINMLENILKEHHADRKLLIVSMSAASNVTGIMSDTERIASITHKYGGISLWDYATGAPYLKIDMNPSRDGYKDAVVISPHKFVGGVGTPGLLIAKRRLFNNPVPSTVGGGVVNWVTQQNHEYLSNIEEREEGGTPAIVESIRAGLAFQIKAAIGEEVIEGREQMLTKLALKKWEQNPNIAILGSHQAKRLPIFSFLIKHRESGKFLHHNFVSILFNDLYGIQVRGGCACAGPYAQDLLSMSEDMALKFTQFLSQEENEDDRTQLGIMKPGFARLNMPYFYDDETINYIIECVNQVANNGWKLLPLYEFNDKTGDWSHRKHKLNSQLISLRDIQYSEMNVRFPTRQCSNRKQSITLSGMMSEATQTIEHAKKLAEGINFDNDPELQEKLPNGMNSSFIWFLEPKEAHRLLKNSHLDVCTEIPYTGPIYIRRHTPNLHTPQRQRSPGLTLRRRRLVTPTNGLVVDKTSISNGVIGQPQTSQHRGIPQILVIPDPDDTKTDENARRQAWRNKLCIIL